MPLMASFSTFTLEPFDLSIVRSPCSRLRRFPAGPIRLRAPGRSKVQ
jgi:hypothetical protein